MVFKCFKKEKTVAAEGRDESVSGSENVLFMYEDGKDQMRGL